MKKPRILLSLALICLLLTSGLLPVCAEAAQPTTKPHQNWMLRATKDFDITVEGGEVNVLRGAFPLVWGDQVTIKATYSPFSANVDFGLIDEDGYFNYINVTDGSIDAVIEIENSGSYQLAIRNNAAKSITVSGFVEY